MYITQEKCSMGVQVSALFFPDALLEIQATAVLD